MLSEKDAALLIEDTIKDFISCSPLNRLHDEPGERAFEDYLLGFAGGADPIFADYKKHVGPFHWTPKEIFEMTFPGEVVDASELTVVSWILPHTSRTREDNSREHFYPAERWARARIYGEETNRSLRKAIVEALGSRGIMSVAPMLSPYWERRDSERFVYASTWSERHAAYAAGLGTFGLCDGLITPKGKAMRAGSLVARVAIEPTQRPYKDHNAYCLFYSKGICGKCIKRCPAGALSRDGHDKVKCCEHIRKNTAPYVESRFGFRGYGCGLCQTNVPCESKIPVPSEV
jgi:epoxyqueuosine reductase QueG